MLLCPKCETLLDVSTMSAGSRFQCPFCERGMVLPHRRPRPRPAPVPSDSNEAARQSSSVVLHVLDLPIASPPSPANRPEWIDWNTRRRNRPDRP